MNKIPLVNISNLRRSSTPLVKNRYTDYSNRRALAHLNTLIQLQATDTLPPFDLASYYLGRRTISASLVYESTPDSYILNSTLRDEGRLIYLSNYLLVASMLAEDRER